MLDRDDTAPLPEPRNDTTPETPADSRPEPASRPENVGRAPWTARAVISASLAVCWAATAAVSYQLGQERYATPPGEVTVVDGATPVPGFAAAVHRAAGNSIVHIAVDGGGTGTGFFYSPTRIVTNAHVVASSPKALAALGERRRHKVTVTLADGRTRTATVLGVDSRMDIAILGVPDDVDVQALPFIDSEDLVTGQPVAVLGHPFGGDQMLTTGVLSGISRNSRFAASDVQSLMLQTDAAVNPGNSGGPLLDSRGRVVGVITLRPDEADGRQVSGLSLAIPANSVRAVIGQLEDDGVAEYPVMGVVLRDATPDDPRQGAAVVVDVTAGSGAAKSGIGDGDYITSVDDQPVHSSLDVIEELVGRTPGQILRVGVTDADGVARTVTVRLGER